MRAFLRTVVLTALVAAPFTGWAQTTDIPEVAPPALAPFTAPASRPLLEPPAPLANFDDSDIENKFIELQSEAMVSTGGKREQRVRDVPLTISWIPAEELEGTGNFTLCDAIQYFPGMECRRGAMRKAAISARGLGSNFLSNRILFLQDGRPGTDPWTGIFYPDETTPLTNLKQIEVIRGPGSALYGSNAFSGVINMVQRTPDDLIKPGRSVGADARLLAGQYGTVRGEATVAGRVGDLKALVNYYGLHSDGPNLLDLSSHPRTMNGKVYNQDTQEWSNVQQVSAQLELGDFGVNAQFNDANIGRPGGTQVSNVGVCGRCHYTPLDSERAQNFNASVHYEHRFNDWFRIFAQGYTFIKRRAVDLYNEFTETPETSLGKRRRLGAEVRALIKGGGFTVTLGGDAKNDVVNNQNILPTLTDDDTRENIFGAFADAEYRIGDKLILSGGARYDIYQIPENVWSRPSSELSPRGAIIYNVIPELTLRANYGHAFRAPSLAELALNQQMYAATLLGNPNLKAERLDQVELAADTWLSQGTVRMTATGFYSKAGDLISQSLVAGSTSQFENVGSARVWGVEAEVAAQVKKINSSFDIAYQFLNARVFPNSGASNIMDYAPSSRVYARGRTNFLSNRLYAELYLLYVGARLDPATAPTASGEFARVTLPAYLTANARVGVNVLDNLSVSVLAQNLFNTRYEEMYGYPMPGLSVYGQVRFTY